MLTRLPIKVSAPLLVGIPVLLVGLWLSIMWDRQSRQSVTDLADQILKLALLCGQLAAMACLPLGMGPLSILFQGIQSCLALLFDFPQPGGRSLSAPTALPGVVLTDIADHFIRIEALDLGDYVADSLGQCLFGTLPLIHDEAGEVGPGSLQQRNALGKDRCQAVDGIVARSTAVPCPIDMAVLFDPGNNQVGEAKFVIGHVSAASFNNSRQIESRSVMGKSIANIEGGRSHDATPFKFSFVAVLHQELIAEPLSPVVQKTEIFLVT